MSFDSQPQAAPSLGSSLIANALTHDQARDIELCQGLRHVFVSLELR